MFDVEMLPNYDKFSLKGNPFLALSSESIKNIEDIHVSQTTDARIAQALSHVLQRESVCLCLVGELGSGKTQRLHGITNLILGQGGYALYRKMDASDVFRVAEEIFANFYTYEEEPTFMEKLTRLFEKKRRRRNVLHELREKTFDSTFLGERLKKEMGRHAPSAFLLDEMENLMEGTPAELILFFEMLRTYISDLPPSSIFACATTPAGFLKMKELFPAFVSRFHYVIDTERLAAEKACELVAKRLTLTRTRELVDPLFPFDTGSVALANDIARGNPRFLLRVLQIVTTEAAREKFANKIDDRFISQTIRAPTTVQEYLSKVPGDLRDIVSLIVKKYNGGPASVIQISKDTKTSVTTAYMLLGELAQLRLLSENKGKYEVTPDVAEMLGRRVKRKE